MSKVLKGLLIGCGFFAKNQLHAWADVDGAEITAVCDLDPLKAQAYAEEFGIPAWHTSADILVSGTFDFVDICTTMDTHEALVALAVQHNVPVIVQKPFAPDLDTCRRIVAHAKAADVPLMVHENFRFQKLFRRIHEIIQSGEIGDLTFGRFSWRNAIDVYSNQPYLLKTERFMIMDVGIHMLDLARFIFGNANAVSCINQSVKEGLAGEDAATILLRHDNGATSIVDVSYASHRFPNPFPQTLGEIEGRLGSIQIIEDQRLIVHASKVERPLDGQKPLTAGDVKARFAKFTRGEETGLIIGTPDQVAEKLGQLAEEAGIDGFLISQPVSPGTVDDFVELVVPALKKRGLFDDKPKQGTLRSRLSLNGKDRLPTEAYGARFRQIV